MWVELTIYGEIDEEGILGGIEFGAAKAAFRHYLNSTYDHHLLLNKDDPWTCFMGIEEQDDHLPGLTCVPDDPTTENIARWICAWAENEFELPVRVTVHETAVNAATVKSLDEPIHVARPGR